MKRTLLIAVTAKERDYLIRILRSERYRWLRAATARQEHRPDLDAEMHAEWVAEATDNAEVAGAMAVRIDTEARAKPCTS